VCGAMKEVPALVIEVRRGVEARFAHQPNHPTQIAYASNCYDVKTVACVRGHTNPSTTYPCSLVDDGEAGVVVGAFTCTHGSEGVREGWWSERWWWCWVVEGGLEGGRDDKQKSVSIQTYPEWLLVSREECGAWFGPCHLHRE